MPLDIGEFEWIPRAEDGVDFVIKSPRDGTPLADEKGIPLTINAGGAESSRIKAAVRERIETRKADPKSDQTAKYTAEMQEADMIDDLVTLTNNWSNNWALDGEPLKFSKENAAMLYRRFPEIAIQMVENVSKRVNFMRGSSKA
jgi:hypothetical protein